ncbi:MAG: alpha/beta hydrolase [Eubacterium sp.]|nr:alpha/beta hydrolase [Eubacterium sp.]
MKNKIVKAMIFISALVSSLMAFGWSFFSITIRARRKKNKYQKERKFQLRHLKINHPKDKFRTLYEDGKAWSMEQPKKDCYITSKDGLLLHAAYLPAQNAKRILILCHGYRGTAYGDFANIAKYLHEHNCSLLFVDERCCGESEGEYITFGAMEQWDIQRWAYYVARRNKKNLPIYLYGMSMGAASVLMASGHDLPPDVKGLIADCGFSSMEKQMRDMAKNWYHLKWIELEMLSMKMSCELFGGFHMKDADVTEALKKNRRPVLFFHGSRDTFVDPKNSKRNYAMCCAPKELVIVPTARHLCSSYEQPELYRKKLMNFFNKTESLS